MRMADPLDQSSADTQNQTPKQKQSKVEDTDQVPLFPRSLFQRFEPQNGGACVLRPASSPTFHSFLDHDSDDDKHDAVLKHKPTHKVDLQESPAPKQSKGNFDWQIFNDAVEAAAKAIRAQSKPATEIEPKPMFTFTAMEQDLPEMVTNIPAL